MTSARQVTVRSAASAPAAALAAHRLGHRPIVELASDLTVGIEVRTTAGRIEEVALVLEAIECELLAAGHPADGWWVTVRPMGFTAEVAVVRSALEGALGRTALRGAMAPPVVEVSEQALAAVLRDHRSEVVRSWEVGAVRLGLSDLGAGVLGPGELQRIPLAHVRVGIDGLEPDEPADAAALAELVGDARSLGARVIADGIETDEQVAFIAEAGIGLALGYRWGSPGSLAKLLQTWARAS